MAAATSMDLKLESLLKKEDVDPEVIEACTKVPQEARLLHQVSKEKHCQKSAPYGAVV